MNKLYCVELDSNNYSSDVCLIKSDGFDEAYKIVWDHIRKDAELTDFLECLDYNKEDIEDFLLRSESEISRTYISKSYMRITITLIDIDKEYTYLAGFAE